MAVAQRQKLSPERQRIVVGGSIVALVCGLALLALGIWALADGNGGSAIAIVAGGLMLCCVVWLLSVARRR